MTVLEGANPSAEGEDEEGGGENDVQRVLDIEDQFRLVKIEGVSKKAYTSELKSMRSCSVWKSLLTSCSLHEEGCGEAPSDWQIARGRRCIQEERSICCKEDSWQVRRLRLVQGRVHGGGLYVRVGQLP